MEDAEAQACDRPENLLQKALELECLRQGVLREVAALERETNRCGMNPSLQARVLDARRKTSGRTADSLAFAAR